MGVHAAAAPADAATAPSPAACELRKFVAHRLFGRSILSEVGGRVVAMAVGQQVLSAAEDLLALDAAMLRLEVRELTRGAEHVALLREVLDLRGC